MCGLVHSSLRIFKAERDGGKKEKETRPEKDREMDRTNNRRYQSKEHPQQGSRGDEAKEDRQPFGRQSYAAAVIGSKRGGEKNEEENSLLGVMEVEDDDRSVEESDYGNNEEEGGSSVPSIWSEDKEKSDGEWGIKDTWEEGKKEKKLEPQNQISNNSSIEIINQEKGVVEKGTPGLETSGINKSVGPSELGPKEDMINNNGKNIQMGLDQSNRVGPKIENGSVVNKAKSKNGGIGTQLEKPNPKHYWI
ncbi:hypothetical protein L6452_37489 [Arctium lappa]|uniref:Uncharacterized protein n=1 Tax=Arctium lappa TaxID=4217 RepID=A0ACB8Y334_ARCLA|nr:hypothetical protein L6452_37489 [Arctium lappa]